MYTSQPETATVTSSYAESTKYVADILSSMANGGVETPTSRVCNWSRAKNLDLTCDEPLNQQRAQHTLVAPNSNTVVDKFQLSVSSGPITVV
ncbi:hypothetical protein RRG08_023628 [Elysia crispata]|uniref:Uncharacterized protein n=1 Tax=Elysia crispata TaxID=231223 RepID=A0AAE0XS96_9GAST|nr:hypothetical protein RRG08_023628 [Elysia crispata]